MWALEGEQRALEKELWRRVENDWKARENELNKKIMIKKYWSRQGVLFQFVALYDFVIPISVIFLAEIGQHEPEMHKAVESFDCTK